MKTNVYNIIYCTHNTTYIIHKELFTDIKKKYKQLSLKMCNSMNIHLTEKNM